MWICWWMNFITGILQKLFLQFKTWIKAIYIRTSRNEFTYTYKLDYLNQRAVSLAFEISWLLWRTSRFNVQKLCILSTDCICMFHMSTLTATLSQNTLTGLCNGQDCSWCEVGMNYYVQFVSILFFKGLA